MKTRKTTRLDHVLCCNEWRRIFSSNTVRHLSHAYLDHCSILLELGGVKKRCLGDRPFHFHVAWSLHPEFYKWMEREWIRERHLMHSLRDFSEKLTAWNRDTFGCIFERKRKLRWRLEGVSRAIDARPTLGLIKLEKKFKENGRRLYFRRSSYGCKSHGSIG